MVTISNYCGCLEKKLQLTYDCSVLSLSVKTNSDKCSTDKGLKRRFLDVMVTSVKCAPARCEHTGPPHSQFSVYSNRFYTFERKQSSAFAEARTRVSCVSVEEGKGCVALR